MEKVSAMPCSFSPKNAAARNGASVMRAAIAIAGLTMKWF
jgi:hypothetical protein